MTIEPGFHSSESPESLHPPDSHDGAGFNADVAAASAPASRLTPRFGIPAAAIGILVLVVTFFSYQIVGGGITILTIGASITADTVAAFRTATVITQIMLLALPAAAMAVIVGWRLRDVLRLRLPSARVAGITVVGVISLQFALQGYMTLQEWAFDTFLLPDALRSLVDMLDEMMRGLYTQLLAIHSPMELFAVWITVALTPAICEEVVFRGTVQWAFERGMRTRWALVLTGVLFGMFHLHPFNVVALTVLGVYLSVLVWRGGSIWLAVLAHLVNNSLAVFAVWMLGPEAANPDATIGPTGVIGAAISIGSLAVFLISLFFFWRWTRPHPSHPTL